MMLDLQKRMAADVLKSSPHRIWLNPEHLNEIKEAITKSDIRGLINKGFIVEVQKQGHSRGRTRVILLQKRKGRRGGQGSRKGRKGARLQRKRAWISKIRVQRDFLKEIRDKTIVDKKTYRDLFLMSKGGFSRSRRHIKLYMEEHKLGQNGKKTKETTVEKKNTGKN